MGFGNGVLAGLLAIGFVLIAYAIYALAIVGIAWLVWNWVLVPSLPHIHSIFWGV